MALSQPGLLFRSSTAGTDAVTELVGRTFFSLAGGDSEVLAMCQDGVHGVGANDTVALSELPLTHASAGRGFYVGIDSEKKLYSWGNAGHSGQLGHGACHQFLEAPTKINHSAEFVEVSCGQSFTLALDNKGGAHAWGENFERQLGLYTKTKAQMHLQNAMVEDLSFVPRLIPLSISHPITKVACGQKFALVITKGGVCYSWGAGECGQLGTGRCTLRDVPAPVLLRTIDAASNNERTPSTPLLVSDIACGAGHVLAVSQTGELYAWGLNKSHQLGNNSTTTEHFPIKIPHVQQVVPDPSQASEQTNEVSENVVFTRVFAHTHSSAAIDQAGKLYTWGSALNDRLMHILPLQPVVESVPKVLSYRELRTQRMACAPGHIGHSPASRVEARTQHAAELAARRLPISTVSRPTLVRTPHLADCEVHDFAFAASHSAALVLTCLKKAWPTEGPRRSFSKLQLLGDGFWEAPNIIVKFTYKQSQLSTTTAVSNNNKGTRAALPGDPGFNPPRSCSGRCVNSGTIECKPPKFSQPGVYSVSLSMDGVYFLPDSLEIFVHQDLVVQKQMPELLDLSASAIVELHVSGLSSMPSNWQGTYTVRLAFTNLEKDSGAGGSYNNTARTASTKTAANSRKYPQHGASTSQLPREDEPAADFTVLTVATLVPPTTRASTPATVHSQDTDNEDDRESEEKAAPVEEEPTAAVLLCTHLDLSEFQATAGRALYEMRCQVSLNGQDFTSLKVVNPHARLHHQRSTHHSNPDGGIHTEHSHEMAGGAPTVAAVPSTLVYAFTPDALQPSCLSLSRFTSTDLSQHSEAETLSLAVHGRSFLPASRLPKGARVVATLSPCLRDIVWEAGFTPQLTSDSAGDLHELIQTHYDVRCDSFSALTVTIDSEAAAHLQRLVTAINCLASGQPIPSETDASFHAAEEGSVKEAATAPAVAHSISILPIQLDFAMILSTGQLLPLTSYSADCPPVRLTLYQDQPLQIVPSLARSTDTALRTYTLLVNRPVHAADLAAGLAAGSAAVGDGFDFHSDDLVVAVYVPMPGTESDLSSGTVDLAAAFYPPLLLPSTDVRLCPVSSAPLLTEPGEEKDGDQQSSLAAKYLLQFALPSLTDLVATVSSSGACGMPSFVYLTCWLDGRTVPAPSNWSKLLYVGDNLIADSVVNPAAPKTGFLPGNAVTLDLTVVCPPVPVVHPSLLQLPAVPAGVAGVSELSHEVQGEGQGEGQSEMEREVERELLEVDAEGVVTSRTDLSSLLNEPMALAPQPQQYVVRIRGAPTAESPAGASITIPGRLANPTGTHATSLAFEIPETIKSHHDLVPVQKTPKDKAMYFVDVSIDGGATFDSAEHPLLFLK